MITITVTCAARSETRPTTSAVWGTFVNNSGWPDGLSFLIGTLTPQFMYQGLDGAMHLAEECKDPGEHVDATIPDPS